MNTPQRSNHSSGAAASDNRSRAERSGDASFTDGSHRTIRPEQDLGQEASPASPISGGRPNGDVRPGRIEETASAGGGVVGLSPNEVSTKGVYNTVRMILGRILHRTDGVDGLKTFSQWLAVSSGSFALGDAIALWVNGIPRPSLFVTLQQSTAMQLASQGWNTVTINLLWTALFGLLWAMSTKGGPMDRLRAWSQHNKLWATEKETAAAKERSRKAADIPEIVRLRTTVRAFFGIKEADAATKERRKKRGELVWNVWLSVMAVFGVWAGITMSALTATTAIRAANLATTFQAIDARSAVTALTGLNLDQPVDMSAYHHACTVAQVRADDRLDAGSGHIGNNGASSDAVSGVTFRIGGGLDALILAANEKLLYTQGCRDAPTMARNLQKIGAQIDKFPGLATDRWPIIPGWVAQHAHVQALARQAVELTPAAWTGLQASRLATEERLHRRSDWSVRNTTPSGQSPEAAEALLGHRAGQPATTAAGEKLLQEIATQQAPAATPEELAALLYVAAKPGQKMDTKTPVPVEQVREAMAQMKAVEPEPSRQTTGKSPGGAAPAAVPGSSPPSKS